MPKTRFQDNLHVIANDKRSCFLLQLFILLKTVAVDSRLFVVHVKTILQLWRLS